MKNVCFLIGNLNSQGGTERVTSLIANNLSEQDYKVSILSLYEGTNPYFEISNKISIYSLMPKKVSFKKAFIKIIEKIRSFIKRHKINTLIVVDSISCMFTIPAIYGLRVNHICWEHFNFNNNNGTVIRDIARKLAARYCDYVVTLTEKDRNLWKKNLRSIKADIIAIPNPSPYTNTQHKPTLEYKSALAIGRLSYQKGFDILLEVWAKFCENNDDWMLYIVGDGADKNKLLNQAKNLNISNRVELVGSVKNINIYYKMSSIYCMSSRFEGFPMVLLEAQSFGLPIIAFDCDTGPKEIIEGSNAGYVVEAFNTEAFTEKLIKTVNDYTLYEEFVENAIKNSKNFTVPIIIEYWKEIL